MVGRTVLEELNTIGTDGRVTAESWVEFARNENTASHALFEWDNTVAGEQYRLLQARQMLRRIRFQLEEPKIGEIEPRFIHVTVKQQEAVVRYYVKSTEATLPEWLSALREAKKDLEAAQRRVEELHALQPERLAGIENPFREAITIIRREELSA